MEEKTLSMLTGLIKDLMILDLDFLITKVIYRHRILNKPN